MKYADFARKYVYENYGPVFVYFAKFSDFLEYLQKSCNGFLLLVTNFLFFHPAVMGERGIWGIISSVLVGFGYQISRFGVPNEFGQEPNGSIWGAN